MQVCRNVCIMLAYWLIHQASPVILDLRFGMGSDLVVHETCFGDLKERPARVLARVLALLYQLFKFSPTHLETAKMSMSASKLTSRHMMYMHSFCNSISHCCHFIQTTATYKAIKEVEMQILTQSALHCPVYCNDIQAIQSTVSNHTHLHTGVGHMQHLTR